MQLLFEETTTLGIRSYEVDRRTLERQTVRVETVYGPIDVKVARLAGRVVNSMPEFEQCRLAARAASVPLRVVEEAAQGCVFKDRRLRERERMVTKFPDKKTKPAGTAEVEARC